MSENTTPNFILKFFKSDRGRIKLEASSELILNRIQTKFSVTNPSYRFSRYAQPTISPISPNGSFLPGMIFDICVEIKKEIPSIKLDFQNVKDIILPFSYNIEALEQPENTKYKYFDYQEVAIKVCLKNGRGCIVCATSGGKSLIMYGLIKNLWQHTGKTGRLLILVPNIQLVKQMQSDFIDYGCSPDKICVFSSFAKDIEDKQIIISNRQWLERHSEELPTDFEYLFCDEMHTLAASNKVSLYVNKFKTQSKFGFTATLPDKETAFMDYYNAIGICGKVLFTRLAKELQETGSISNLKIISIKFNHVGVKQPEPPTTKQLLNKDGEVIKTVELDDFERAQLKYSTEWAFIEKCKNSNETLSKLALSLKKNTILLFDHTEHGKTLLEIINRLNVNNAKLVYFINGETEVEIREDIRKDMETKDNIILIANTKCLGTGISIKNIFNLIFGFTSAKSAVKVLQAIGRSLRKLEGKQFAILYDIYHSFKYSTQHFGIRLKMYNKNYKVEDIIYKEIKI